MIHGCTHADPGGATGTLPQQDPILSFLHTFLSKKCKCRGLKTPNGSPPTGNPDFQMDLKLIWSDGPQTQPLPLVQVRLTSKKCLRTKM